VKDIMDELTAVTRETGAVKTRAGDGHMVALRRTYGADIRDVWDALTSAERIPRWFLPINGDLRVGGRYQLEGNAGGEILACEPPSLLRISWVMGPESPDTFSEVEVRLSTVDDATVLVLEHKATVPPEMWDQYGPGAVGVGWELALLGLGLFVIGGDALPEDKEAWAVSEEGRAFATASSQGWGDAALAAGTDPETVAANVAATTAFYVPPTQ
jgi:uncharacterized protein YndB with AHSA1/START domain